MDQLDQSCNSDTKFYLDNRGYYLEMLRREHVLARHAETNGTTRLGIQANLAECLGRAVGWLRTQPKHHRARADARSSSTRKGTD